MFQPADAPRSHRDPTLLQVIASSLKAELVPGRGDPSGRAMFLAAPFRVT